MGRIWLDYANCPLAQTTAAKNAGVWMIKKQCITLVILGQTCGLPHVCSLQPSAENDNAENVDNNI